MVVITDANAVAMARLMLAELDAESPCLTCSAPVLPGKHTHNGVVDRAAHDCTEHSPQHSTIRSSEMTCGKGQKMYGA